MTTLLNGKHSTNRNAEKCDDFRKIRGIGRVKQQWLKNLLNIHTFHDLVGLSVDEIESRLKAEGQSVSRSEIEGWIVQAQELAAAELSLQQFVESPEAGVEEALHLPSHESDSCEQLKASGDAEVKGSVLPPTQQGEWQSFASFRVEFQSRKRERQQEEQRITVHYLEGDKIQIWSNIESDRLQQWMLDQMIERMQQSPGIESPIAASAMAVAITQIRAFQPPQTNRPMVAEKNNRLFPGTINSGNPFALEIDFNLASLNAANITKKAIAYCAEFYARNRVTGVVTHLGNTEPVTLSEGQIFYTATLAETKLEPGVYRLQAIVKLQGLPTTLGSFKVPLFQIV